MGGSGLARLNLVVVGCGQLGSRHIQALKLMPQSATIYGFDPSPDSLAVAQQRFDAAPESESGQTVEFLPLDSIEKLPEEAAVIIYATDASSRRQAVEQTLARTKTRYVVLEKFLFPQEKDYQFVADLFSRHAVSAWVNCTRRQWPIYQRVKDTVKDAEKIEIDVVGSNFGLASSAVHFLDLGEYLSGSAIEVRQAQLDPEFAPARRPGFVEFTGEVVGWTQRGSRVTQKSLRSGSEPVLVNIDAGDLNWRIEEGKGCASLLYNDDRPPEQVAFSCVPQSQLSHIVASDLLDRGHCDLTPFSESMNVHIQLLRPYLDHIARYPNPTAREFPIT